MTINKAPGQILAYYVVNLENNGSLTVFSKVEIPDHL
jgi:hypothetical protein